MSMLELREVTEAESSWKKIKGQEASNVSLSSLILALENWKVTQVSSCDQPQLAVGKSPAEKEFDLAVID